MKLKSKRGMVELVGCTIFMFSFIAMAAGHHYVTTGKNIFKAKPKTVDTIENPAKPEVPYTNYE